MLPAQSSHSSTMLEAGVALVVMFHRERQERGYWAGALLRGKRCHFQRDALPQFLCLLSSFQVLQHVVELHHADRRQAKSTPSTANNVDKVVVVGGGQMNKSVVDVLWRERERRRRRLC